MPKQFISDIIDLNVIGKWKLGDRILIHSQTGTGKSQFIKDILYEYCKRGDKKILLLSNRNLLKNQNQEEISNIKSEIITLKNYQELETNVLLGGSIEELFSSLLYKCLDVEIIRHIFIK